MYNIYIVVLIIVLIVGFIVAYQSEIESQDCTQRCSHWVHDNKSRWRQNITLGKREVITERMGLFYSAVEWRRSLIATIIITVVICLAYVYFTCDRDSCSILKRFVISFVYVFIVIFFIGMYYQDMWKHVLKH